MTTENEAHLNRYVHELTDTLIHGWPGIRLHGDRDGGSIEEFLRLWASEETEYQYKEESTFKLTNALYNLVETYIEATALHACEKSDHWPDRSKKHTTYLRGNYLYLAEYGADLRFLVRIQQRVVKGELYCRISAASRSAALSKVMACAFQLYVS